MPVFDITTRLLAPQTPNKARTSTLRCSACNCDRLAVRQLTGLEAIISKLTGTRKYRCFICKKEFRAPDRRKRRRDAQGNVIRDELRIPV